MMLSEFVLGAGLDWFDETADAFVPRAVVFARGTPHKVGAVSGFITMTSAGHQ
jgi:hypothetical protein